MTIIYKICSKDLWQEAETSGTFHGAAIDLKDGFIHFSTAVQVQETAAKHFHDIADLLLIAIEADSLGDALKWESSRGGALFPHLYAPLSLSTVKWVKELPLGTNGQHRFPEGLSS